MQRARILRLAAFRIVAARHHQNALVAGGGADLVEIDAFFQIVGLADLVPEGAVGFDAVDAQAGRKIIRDQRIFAGVVDARVDRPPAQLDHVAMRRELAGRADPEGGQVVLVGREPGPGVKPGPPVLEVT